MIASRKFRPLLLFAIFSTVALAAPTVGRVDRVVVLKKKHKLLLLSGDQILRSYDIALGRGGLRPKQRQGDGRTPEGLYSIDSRNPASKFHLALHISYPQVTDRLRARQVGAHPGGDIEIHGLGRYAWVGANHRLDDWTEGCIAVTDSEIEEIWQMVPDGTPIEIRP